MKPLARCSYSNPGSGQKAKLIVSTARRYCTVLGPPSVKCSSADQKALHHCQLVPSVTDSNKCLVFMYQTDVQWCQEGLPESKARGDVIACRSSLLILSTKVFTAAGTPMVSISLSD